jgi:PIN domain nuclease of toxin-antitoxin system
MVRVILDTHTLIWWALDDPKPSRKAHSILSSFETEVFVSAASAWEIATKVRLGKLPGPEAFAAEFPARLSSSGSGNWRFGWTTTYCHQRTPV